MPEKIAVGIKSTHDDPFYRYQRDKLQVTSPNKAGQVTLTNIETVAQQLETDKSKLLKFLGKALKTNVTEKKSEVKMNGTFTSDQVEEAIQAYTEAYVLCPSENCRKPELETLDSGDIKCKACGHQTKGESSSGKKSKKGKKL